MIDLKKQIETLGADSLLPGWKPQSARDPLIDPQPGDLLKPSASSVKSRTVTWRDGDDVRYAPHFTGFSYPQRTCWISTWRKWCRKNKAVVVRRANDC